MVLLTLFGAGQLGLGLALFAYGAPHLPAAQTALLNALEPILGPLWVWMVIGERPSDATLIGGAVVLAALLVHTLDGLKRR
ncbi:MAG: DMT family transporter [Hyphomicrobiaceae bacterium]